MIKLGQNGVPYDEITLSEPAEVKITEVLGLIPISIGRDLARTVLTVGAADNDIVSDEIDTSEFNSLDVRVNVTGAAAFLVKIKGSLVSGGQFVDRLDVGLFSTTRGVTIPQVPAFCKIEVIRVSGTGTCTVDVQPCNVFGNLQRPAFKEYILALNEATPALNAETSFFDVYNTDWVRSIVMSVNSPFDYQVMYRHMFSNLDASGGNVVGSTKTKGAFFASTSLNVGSFVPSPYGMRFSLKNMDASVITGTVKMHLILMGN
jgi:hypothetical protein